MKKEAQKLAKMNEEQKKQYKQEKIQTENENMKNHIVKLEIKPNVLNFPRALPRFFKRITRSRLPRISWTS
ncbi:hypothetical protein [Dubosiella newyorkensis]|uniref:hypothetical protein n=2 Tax=Dubosiella newyorkensis TaxID=1862672 RepID=UPI0032E8CC70